MRESHSQSLTSWTKTIEAPNYSCYDSQFPLVRLLQFHKLDRPISLHLHPHNVDRWQHVTFINGKYFGRSLFIVFNKAALEQRIMQDFLCVCAVNNIPNSFRCYTYNRIGWLGKIHSQMSRKRWCRLSFIHLSSTNWTQLLVNEDNFCHTTSRRWNDDTIMRNVI